MFTGNLGPDTLHSLGSSTVNITASGAQTFKSVRKASGWFSLSDCNSSGTESPPVVTVGTKIPR